MTKRTAVSAASVVEDMGPFSQAVRMGDLLFISGQVSWDESGNVVYPGDPEGQARQAFANMEALLESAGGSMDDVAALTVFVSDIAYASVVSKVRREVFSPPYPAASSVAVAALVLDELLVEIEAIAVLGD